MQQLFKTLKDNYILILLISLAIFLRFYHLDFQSLWVDEINTMIQSTPNQSLLDTYRSLLNNDLQPPLYFYLLKYLFRLFGYNTFILRAFSAILGSGAVVAIYLLGKELVNKKTGLYAALLLGINYFHILYSQEGRPYSFLVLFTLLSFYTFCIFLRRPNFKSAVIYGIMSASMLYGHPIALFAFLAQYLILAFHFLQADKQKRRQFIRQSFVFSLVAIVLYVPAFPLLLSAAKVDSFWIELPGYGTFASTLSQFFGASEMLLTLVYLFLTYFFIKVFGNTEQSRPSLSVPAESSRAFIILIPWLICCTLIPFIRSYLVVPMIIPRYLNIILPVVVLFISIGINHVKSKTVRYSVLVMFVVFSLTDMVIVKDFYNKPSKTDFKSIANAVIENIKPREQVVSRVGWHYSYFFDLSVPRYPIFWNTLEAYVDTINRKPECRREGFWYVDAQDVTVDLTPKAAQFLFDHYLIDSRLDAYQAFGIHFLRKTDNCSLLSFPAYPAINGTLKSGAELELNKTLQSEEVYLQNGNYELLIATGSLPKKRLNNINAHITVTLNGKIIGGLFADESVTFSTKKIKLHVPESQNYRFGFTFDNGFNDKRSYRKGTIYSVFVCPANPLKTD